MANFQQESWEVLWFKCCLLEEVPVGSEKQSFVSDELAYSRVEVTEPLSKGRKRRIVSVWLRIDVLVLVDVASWFALIDFEVVLCRDTHHVLVERQKLRLKDVATKSFTRCKDIIDVLNEVTNTFINYRLEKRGLDFIPFKHFCVLFLNTLFDWIGSHFLTLSWPVVVIHEAVLLFLLRFLFRLFAWLS